MSDIEKSTNCDVIDDYLIEPDINPNTVCMLQQTLNFVLFYSIIDMCTNYLHQATFYRK